MCRAYGDVAELAGEALMRRNACWSPGRRKHGDDEVTVFAIIAAIIDCELQERAVTAPLNVEMIEREPGSR